MTNERMFINFDNFLGIKYIRKVESVYMNTNDFDSMKNNFENIFQENTKLKAETEQLKEEAHQIKYRNCLQCLNYGKCSINGNFNITYCSNFKLKGRV